MIDYNESGWSWGGDISPSYSVSIILNKSKAAIFPKKTGFKDGNIQLLIETTINERCKVNVKIIDKYDFSIDALNGKKIDLINEILNYIRTNNLDLGEYYSKFIPTNPNQYPFAKISIEGGVPIFFSNKPIKKKIPNWSFKPLKSYIIELASIVLEDVENFKLENSKAVLPCTFGTYFRIRQGNSDITTKPKYTFKLNVDWDMSHSQVMYITDSALKKMRKIYPIIDGKKIVEKIEIIDNFIPLFRNSLHISAQGNKRFGTFIHTGWKRRRANKIILDNSDIINPKLIWKFKEGSLKYLESSREIKKINGKWKYYVNNLEYPYAEKLIFEGIDEKIISKIPIIEKTLFPLLCYKKSQEGKIESFEVDRFHTTVNNHWSYNELALHLELKKQDWSEGNEVILNQSFTLINGQFKNIKEAKKWFNINIKKFWMEGDKKDDLTKNIDQFLIENFVIPCKVFLEDNNYKKRITLDSFRNPKKAYSWPFEYTISPQENK